jgi:hypothetical protein
VTAALFVCTRGTVLAFDELAAALDAAFALACEHAAVGVDTDEAGAARAAAHALPGMVCCRRDAAFAGVDCYPLTSTTAFVRPRERRLGRYPVTSTA